MLKSFCTLTISHYTSNPFAQSKNCLKSIEFQLFSTSTIIVFRWEVSYIFFMINYFFSIFTDANDTCLALVSLFFIWIHYYQLYSLLLTFSFIIWWWMMKWESLTFLCIAYKLIHVISIEKIEFDDFCILNLKFWWDFSRVPLLALFIIKISK